MDRMIDKSFIGRRIVIFFPYTKKRMEGRIFDVNQRLIVIKTDENIKVFIPFSVLQKEKANVKIH